MRPILTAAVIALASPLSILRGQPVHFTSGPGQVSLVELYTSEGCSSCPPAERWMGALRFDPRLWRDYVPVSFHVNYWDSLGWPDRLASRSFTLREYAYANLWGSSTVYTPCFILDGAEWKPGPLPRAGSDGPGVLTVELVGGARGRVEFAPSEGAGGGFEVHVALLGGGLTSRVTAGENSGATLEHEFVALASVDRALVPGSGDKALHADFALPPPAVSGAPRQALIAWVTGRGSIVPVQAAGGWLVPPHPPM